MSTAQLTKKIRDYFLLQRSQNLGAEQALEKARIKFEGEVNEDDLLTGINKVFSPSEKQVSPFPVVSSKGVVNVRHPDNFAYFLGEIGIVFGRLLGSTIYRDTTTGKLHTCDNGFITSLSMKARVDFEGYDPPREVLLELTDYAAALGFDALADWATAKPWDGIDRITQLYDCLHATPFNESHQRTVFTKFIVGMVCQALAIEGVRNEITLILSSIKEGVGKTQFARSLAPKGFPILLSHEGGLADDKDSQVRLSETIVFIASEIDASFRKADLSLLKDVLSRVNYKTRKPYAATDSQLRRSCSFIGSTNETVFLPPSGEHRRFIILQIPDFIDYDHKIDMQQVYAQALQMQADGCEAWLDRGEITENARLNARFTWIDSFDDFYSICCECPTEQEAPYSVYNLYAAYEDFCSGFSIPDGARVKYGAFERRCRQLPNVSANGLMLLRFKLPTKSSAHKGKESSAND